jgi:hypothetical protein
MKACPLIVAIFAFVLSVPAAGCGGGDGDGDGTQPLVLYSEPDMDGLVANDGVSDSTGASATIGDGPEPPVYAAQVRRAVVSFNLSPLPTDAAILSATLRIFQTDEATGTTYGESALGDVFVDHVSYTAFSADLYDPTSTIDANIGTLSTDFVANTWRELDVTIAVTDDIQSFQTGRSQFKIYHHYETNHDGFDDTDGWAMGDSPTTPPELVIEYQ